MATRVDLDSIEASVRTYLGGVAPFTGWPLLDTLERHLVAEMIEPGTPDEKRATKLLSAIRTKLGG